MTANAADFGSAALGAFLRAVGLLALAAGAVLALIFAFAAAVVVGLMITGAAITLHFWPRRKETSPRVLEARATPNGWVVETTAKRNA